MSLEDPEQLNQFHELGVNQNKVSRGYPIAATEAEEPIIPDPRIFDPAASNSSRYPGSSLPSSPPPRKLSETIHGQPTVAECATHLELLESFYVLRQRILKSSLLDSVFHIAERPTLKTGVRGDTKKLKDKTFWDRRQIKWPTLVSVASVRFLLWLQTLGTDDSERSAEDEIPLPPLDVLMVWHAFLLNPRLFQLHCSDTPLAKTRFPWKSVHACIDNQSWSFIQPMSAKAEFEKETGLSANLVECIESLEGVPSSDPEEPDSLVAVLNIDATAKQPPSFQAWFEKLDESSQLRRHLMAYGRIDFPLAAQLRDAVIRQASFVDKMNNHLWIRSPALAGTLARAVDRYAKFLRLMKLYPKMMFVPTLDIDLVWHTHQCSPSEYVRGTRQYVGRFINHDDTVGKKVLGNGFPDTRNFFRIRFGLEYNICGCWDCEALKNALDRRLPDLAERDEGDQQDLEAAFSAAKEEVDYFRAVEIARREKKDRLPIRQNT